MTEHEKLVENVSALIADWRARGEEIERLRTSRGLCYRELDVLSVSHKDLAHRLATVGQDAAEAMRARCEAIAREHDAGPYPTGDEIADSNIIGYRTARDQIADAIAAWKRP